MALSFAPPPVAAAPFSLTVWIVDSNSKELIKLGNLGRTPPATTAEGINDAGQVVGQSFTTDPFHPQRAFITGPNGIGMTDLGTLNAYAINSAGQVVGTYQTTANETHAFITGPNGAGLTDIGKASEAVDVNDLGQTVGYFYDAASGEDHAFATGPNGMGIIDLDKLAIPPNGNILQYANDINNLDRSPLPARYPSRRPMP
ncbi:hypothetical protein [Nitrosospira sp. Is2]|uniref:hypothetical protein n=1 Tax=Nitrosospira sp. Is2 TaxID=3080532 RepID=UPI00295411AA|nr:hypothetical protein [Nitrosospira sp. Is2]WON75490.1 hypothetical protein R5L00_15565 [Nitrosospira sp. Is2]